MNCQETEERILEFVTGAEGAGLAPEVEEHLAGCPTCRTRLEDFERLWRDLGRIPVPPPGPGLRDRLEGLLAEAAVATRANARRPQRAAGYLQIAALIAAALVGGLGGYALAGGSSERVAAGGSPGTPADVASATGPSFLLLLREGDAFPVTGEDVQSLVAEYTDWARSLAAEGRLAGAEKLADGGRLLAPAGDTVAVTRLTDTAGEERIGGFFLIRAADLDDALRVTRRSPHLRHGGSIELRRVETEN